MGDAPRSTRTGPATPAATPTAVDDAAPDPAVASTPTPAPADAGTGAEAGTAAPRRTSLARAGTLMAAGTAVSRGMGFLRVGLVATLLGATTATGDAFALANTVPNSLYLLIAGGVLNAVLVPQVVRAMRRDDGGADYLDRLITAGVVVFGVATALLTLAAPAVVWLYSAGPLGDPISTDQRALALAFAYWCLPQIFFYALYTLLGQVLNARGSFGPYMWAPVVNNVVGLAGLGVFAAVVGRHGAAPLDSWTAGEIALLAGSSTLGVVAQALVLLVPLRRLGVRLRPRWGLRGMGFRSAGRTAGWTFAALVVGQVAYLAMTNVAFSARGDTADGDTATAGLAAWGIAYLVFMLPHSLVAVSVVTALFTRMSEAAAQGRRDVVRSLVSTGLRTVGVASLLCTAAVLALARPIAVFITGDDQGWVVARVLVVMVVGLTAFSAQYLFQRAFYAFEDARTPFLLQCITAGVWLLGSLASLGLDPADRVVGAAASMSLGTTASAVVAAVLLRRRLGGLDGQRVVRTHVRLLLAAALAGGAGLGASALLGGDAAATRIATLPVLVVGGLVVLVVFGLAVTVMHVEEVRPLLARLPGGRRRAAGSRPGGGTGGGAPAGSHDGTHDGAHDGADRGAPGA